MVTGPTRHFVVDFGRGVCCLIGFGLGGRCLVGHYLAYLLSMGPAEHFSGLRLHL